MLVCGKFRRLLCASRLSACIFCTSITAVFLICMLHFTQLVVRAVYGYRSNAIGPFGAMAMAQALKANTRIVDLNVANNKIGSIGALRLGQFYNGSARAALRSVATPAALQHTAAATFVQSESPFVTPGVS